MTDFPVPHYGSSEVRAAQVARDWRDRATRRPPEFAFRAFSVDGPEELLSAFVSAWEHDRRVGYKPEFCRGEFPPLSARQAHAIRTLAFDRYWSARLCIGSLDRAKECLAVVDAATEAAVAARYADKPGKSERLRRKIRERDGDECWLCGHTLGDDCTIEHKVARANGGTWAFHNLALAHRECNRALARLPVAAKEAARAAVQERPRYAEHLFDLAVDDAVRGEG